MKFQLLILISHLATAVFLQNTIFYGDLTINDVKGINALSPIRNMNQPTACGASWAFAISSAMSDQFNSIKHVEFPEKVLSPQMLLTCRSTSTSKTCTYSASVQRESVMNVLKNLTQSGISDESCNNWHADDTAECNNLAKCMDCANGENINNKANCFSKDFHSYKLKNYTDLSYSEGKARAIADIRTDLIKALNNKGPVVCNINHSKEMFNKRQNSIGVYTPDGSLPVDYKTWVSVVGYIPAPKSDASNEVTYLWVVKAAFGENTGYYGYFYLDASEGVNSMGILDNCFGLEVDPEIIVVPNSDKTHSNLLKPMITKSFDIRKARFDFPSITQNTITADTGIDEENSVKDPLDTPIFWGNYQGRNYLTWIKNQHIPVYCGSCWAQAATSVLNDRLNIQNIRNNQRFPRFVLSVQAIINCNLGGTCLGGDSGLAWELAKNWKIPTDTCKMYESKNPEKFSCEGESRCSNSSRDSTWVVDKYNGVTVQEWKTIRGADAIKTHLQDGPVVCSFEVTDDFEKYTPKTDQLVIFEQKKMFFEVNHAISIVGWDKDDKGDYWIVRNSSGVEYGYNGLFYFRAGNLLGMEAGCQVPTKFTFSNWEE